MNSVRAGRHKAAEAPNDGELRHIAELDQGRGEMGAGGSECACNARFRPRSWWASGYTSGTLAVVLQRAQLRAPRVLGGHLFCMLLAP